MFKIFLSILIPYFLIAHPEDPQQFDFSGIDEHARNIKKSSTYEKTAEVLTAPFSTELEKTRSIFIWITHNVKYDVTRVSRQNKGETRTKIYANSKEELAEIRNKRERDKANIAFKQGKGVCENYAFLFKFMAEHVGIEAEIVSGYGRNNPSLIGRTPNHSNHAWNRVKIDGKWYLLDATWAAGMTDMEKGKFNKIYQEGFFLSDPSFFLTTHFPDDPKWQLIDQSISPAEFAQMPLGHHALSTGEILDYFPKSGKLDNDPSGITLTLALKNDDLDLVLLDNRQISPLRPVRDGNQFSFTIKSNKLRGHELTLAKRNGKQIVPIISYLVK